MNPFDQAWDLLKAIDYGLLAEMANDGDREKVSRILRDSMSDTTNRPFYPTAKTPDVFRSMSDKELPLQVGDRHPKKYFTPQKITAQQYSHAWKDPARPRKIGRFEMPVSFDDDSVLNLGMKPFRSGGTLDNPKSPVIERLAEGSNISREKAQKIAEQLETAYSFSPGAMNMDELNNLMSNAGVDYVMHDEDSSRIRNPPVWQRFTEKLDSAAKTVPELNQLNQNISNQMGSTPYLSSWHVGDKESAPTFMGYEEKDSDAQNILFGRNNIGRKIDERLFDFQDRGQR
tara:strand:+ start:1303 stop:2163 length:861 start_codon:yes stop_codon:yes gene_type:complete